MATAVPVKKRVPYTSAKMTWIAATTLSTVASRRPRPLEAVLPGLERPGRRPERYRRRVHQEQHPIPGPALDVHQEGDRRPREGGRDVSGGHQGGRGAVLQQPV